MSDGDWAAVSSMETMCELTRHLSEEVRRLSEEVRQLRRLVDERVPIVPPIPRVDSLSRIRAANLMLRQGQAFSFDKSLGQ